MDGHDIEPHQLPPQLQPVVSIAYIPVDAQTLGRARAALIAGDTSGRALHAAAAAIAVNPADYGAWRLRWTCIEKAAERGIEKAAERARESGGQQAERGVWLEELALVECMAGDIPKNYQVWNHWRKVASVLGPGNLARELASVEKLLSEDDGKNYHAWAHRQALVKEMDAWDDELGFTERMLAQDVRNNSAWNHRMLAVRHEMDALGSAGQALMDREVAFTESQLRRAWYNESAWAYLAGLRTLPGVAPSMLHAVPSLAAEALHSFPGCPPALACLGDYLSHLAGELREASLLDEARAASASARGVFEALVGSDTVRQGYWEHRAALESGD